MKVLALVIIGLGCVFARGSGPYLYMRPDGPAFYLPSKPTNPLDNPLQDLILNGSEDSGSDFLQEYGPPKLQEVSQDLTKQGLPDDTSELVFISTVTIAPVEGELKEGIVGNTAVVATEIKEGKVEVNREIKATEEIVAPITESPVIEEEATAAIEVESVTNAEVESIPEILEFTTLASVLNDAPVANVIQTVDVNEETISSVDVTAGSVETTQEIANVENEQTVSEINESGVIDAQQEASGNQQQSTSFVSQQQITNFESAGVIAQLDTEVKNEVVLANVVLGEVTVANVIQAVDDNEETISAFDVTAGSEETTQGIANVENEQSVSEVFESAVIDAQHETSGNKQQSTSFVSQQEVDVTNLESAGVIAQVDTEIKSEVVSTGGEGIQSVVEEAKKVEEIAQKIPEVLVVIENEIKAPEAERIQEIPAIVQETFGILDQGHEGFLEYGPPGFSEYGPPKDDLRDGAIEEQAPEILSVTNNEVRRRRFSPKFSPIKRSH